MVKNKQTKEEAEQEALAFLGQGCLLTTIQAVAIMTVGLLTDFNWFSKWLYIFPILVYVASIITFIIKMIQIELRF